MKVFHSSQTEMANIVNKITQHRTRSGKIYSHFVKLTMNEIQKKRVRKWGLALDQRNTQHNELVLTEARLTASVINVCSIHQPKFLRSKLANCFHIQIHHLSFISGLWIDANTFFFSKQSKQHIVVASEHEHTEIRITMKMRMISSTDLKQSTNKTSAKKKIEEN